MTVRLVCRACGKRLKVPDGVPTDRTARCPKCSTPVDLTAARAARAYSATPLLGADDPLPYLPGPEPAAPSGPKALPPKPSLPPRPVPPPLPAKSEDKSGGLRPPLAKDEKPKSEPHKNPTPRAKNQTPPPGEILSLDDDDASDAPPEVVPFRVPVNVLADSLTASVGPCVAVLLPHGLFLEHEPMKPFLFVPVGAPVSGPAAGELTAVLPDGRTVTLRFAARAARALARDARAFLAGERAVPNPADYRLKWWLLWAALIFALGLAVGPLILSRTTALGQEFGLKVGVGLALAGLASNVLLVLFSRRPVFVQVAVMALACVCVTGLFLSAATAFLAGRQQGLEAARAEAQPAAPVPPPARAEPVPEPPKPPEPRPDRPPSHLDRARKSASSALEDGTADVTALALGPDGKTLAIGHADGSVRLWPLDQATFDPPLPGPRAEGAVTRVQFVASGRFVFAHTATGAFGAPAIGGRAAVAKLPGAPVAVATDPDGDRLRFAAVRGNLLQHRLIRDAFVQLPPGDRGFVTPGKGDEIIPAGAAKDPQRPANLTFLAWTPGGKLFAGSPDGTINMWSAATKADAPSRDHKAPVRAWADTAATGDFATGDDAGNVGIWSAKGGKPTVTSVLATPVTGLSFGPTGARLAVTDSTGWLVIWDVAAGRAIHRVKRATGLKAVALGPGDEFVALAFGRTVEVWWIPELVK